MAVDFSTPEATLATAPKLAALGVNLVVGHDRLAGARGRAAGRRCSRPGSGPWWPPNFSLAANLLDALTQAAGRMFSNSKSYGAFIHEAHHAAKKDAPSGTALMLRRALERGGYALPVDISSTRAGFIPGIHTVGFDGPAETLTLTHTVRDRATLAHGALEAARWVVGRKGWFGMRDVLGIEG